MESQDLVTGTSPAGISNSSPAFGSLSEMQREHQRLVKAVRTGIGNAGASQHQVESVVAFLEKGERLGAILDDLDDRNTAQSMLDYWTATLYTLRSRNRGKKDHAARRHSPESDSSSLVELNALHHPRSDAEPAAGKFSNLPGGTLAKFDARDVRESVERIEQAFKRFSPQQQENARRVLLRLVCLSSDGVRFVTEAVSRPELESLIPKKGPEIVDELAKAGLIRVDPGIDKQPPQVRLAHEWLIRQWPRLAGWLEKRLQFREAVRYWDQHDRDPAATIRGKLLAEAMYYHDLTATERQFIEVSLGNQGRASRIKTSVIIVLVFVTGVAVWSFLQASSALKQASFALDKEREARTQSEIANSTLSATLLLSNSKLITRTALEVLFARTESERKVNQVRFDVLREIWLKYPNDTLQPNDLLDECGKAIKNVDPQDGPSPIGKTDALTKMVFRIRKIRNEMLKPGNQLAMDALVDTRRVIFKTTEDFAIKICDTIEREAFANAEPYIREFWLQYWGTMPIVEGPGVENAKLQFGRALKDIEREFRRRLGNKDLLRNLNPEIEKIPEAIRPNVKGGMELRYQQLNQVTSEATATSQISSKDLADVRALATQKVPPALAKGLRKSCQDLIHELQQEAQSSTISTYATPPMAL